MANSYHFLSEFDKNGGGRGPNSLKFALKFNQSVSHTKSKEVSSVEDFFTRLDGAFSWLGGSRQPKHS